MNHQGTVAVILLTYGDYARNHLEPCYRSLQQQTYPNHLFQVFIVNNGVTEGSRALIARLAPEVAVLENPSNLGWAGGNNTAITVALAQGFDHVVLLNMDTVVDRHWLASLVEAAEARPDIQIWQSVLLLHGTHRVNSLGNRIHYLGYGYCQGYGKEHSAVPRGLPIDYASGAAMLVTREVFEQIGLFREDYFMYYDDVEFCWRARLAGYSMGLAEGSICYHKYEFGNIWRLLYYVERNRLVTLLTLEKFGTLLVIAPCLVVAQVVMSVYCIARGRGAVVVRLLSYFLQRRTWASILTRRRQVHAMRRRKDADIVKRFAGGIVFAEIRNPVFTCVLNPLLRLYWAVVRVLIVW